VKWQTIHPATCAHCGTPVTDVRHVCEQAIKDWLALNAETSVLPKPGRFVYEIFRELQAKPYRTLDPDPSIRPPMEDVISDL